MVTAQILIIPEIPIIPVQTMRGCAPPSLDQGSLTWETREPEAQDGEPEVGDEPAAVGGPAVPGRVVPRAAANDPARALTLWIMNILCAILSLAVKTPFIHIPSHVQRATFRFTTGKTTYRAGATDACLAKIHFSVSASAPQG